MGVCHAQVVNGYHMFLGIKINVTSFFAQLHQLYNSRLFSDIIYLFAVVACILSVMDFCHYSSCLML
jgi:hypothetical protein